MAPNVTLKDGKNFIIYKRRNSIVIDEEKDDGMTPARRGLW